MEGLALDERAMTQAIIGTVSVLDMPLTPAAKGLRAMSLYLTNQSQEEIQKEREQILDATAEDIRALAVHLRAILSDGCLCVMGGEKKLKEEKEHFLTLKPLYQGG